jgi:hypothetical protein
MAKVQALHPEQRPPRSPERDALAAGVARHQAAQADVERIKAARERFYRDVLGPADRAVEDASTALAEVVRTATDARQLAAVFLGETEAATSMAELKKGAADAKAALATAESTNAGLLERLVDADQELEWAESQRDTALAAAIAHSPEMAALIARFEAARYEAARLIPVFEVIGVRNVPKGFLWSLQRSCPAPPEATVWRDAIEALKADADAALPGAPVA